MKKKKPSKKIDNSIPTAFLIYAVLAGLAVNIYTFSKRKELGLGTAAIGFGMGWIMLPAMAIVCPLIWLDEHVKLERK